MPGESQQTPNTEPDPSVLTTEQMLRQVRAEREWTEAQLDVLRERLDGIDKATALLNAQVTRVPTDVDKQVGNLKELHTEKFNSIKEQFVQNAASLVTTLAAQEKFATKQEETFKESIGKSERTTNETIRSLDAKVDDLKDRLGDQSSRLDQAQGAKAGATGTTTAIIAAVSLFLFVVSVGISIALAFKK